jgi:hydrophobic/amphiphilic exporter-1 (mainly G- bacteria), HAE1 family
MGVARAFILGVVPLVLATGAGANACKSIGIAVFSGVLTSTCLAVLFVPSFFVLVRRFEERRRGTPSRESGRSSARRVGCGGTPQRAAAKRWYLGTAIRGR